MKAKPIPQIIENEIEALELAAAQISKQSKLPEICTNVVLYAILSTPAYTACKELERLGADINYMRKAAADSINRVATNVSLKSIPLSNALIGLMHLNGHRNTTSLHLLKTIIRNDNTAAARILKSGLISLNSFGQLTLKTF